MSEALAQELGKGRRLRWRVTAMFVTVIVIVAGAFAFERWQRAHDCDTAYRVREHSEQLDRDLFRALGERLNAPEAEIESFMQTIDDSYHAMPEPAAC